MEMVLRSVATCSLSTLPTSFLLHTWWSGFATNMTNVFGYISCLEISGIHAHHNYLACVDRYLSAICPRKFDPNDERTWICADYLWYGRKVARPGEANFKSKTEGFLQCVDKFAIPIKSCAVNHLDSVCASKSVRAIKTVRMTLTDTLQVMDRISSDYRIISLTREPIGVINSRVKGSFAQGFYERQNVSRMAELYCQMSVEIHNSQTNLPMKIRTMEVSHAQVVAQPIRTFSEIFEFIGMLSIPDGSRMFLEAARRRYSAKSQDPYSLEFVRQVSAHACSRAVEQTALFVFAPQLNWLNSLFQDKPPDVQMKKYMIVACDNCGSFLVEEVSPTWHRHFLCLNLATKMVEERQWQKAFLLWH
ncbi:hypothetical protein CAPTEDRAFT_184981 [Capitella teleta]|uniref:Sulfotransferase domain-containing protein n=1 Tax=Capitella teleta TaxID=283909 RepID=R7VE54_CAPTE|nr:hypothetical protein CAPTEDRAFT_184981 [Capitella teleta]|eukprot:ELU16847.1 hypothetical protein CAPTEDRAFT_184981 [Capitella teleta]